MWWEHFAAELKEVLSVWTIVGWKLLRSPGSWTFSLSEGMLSFYMVQHKPAHKYLGLERLPCGQTTPLQPFAVPLKRLLTTLFRKRGLAQWPIRLISCDKSYAPFQPGSSGNWWLWLWITGASAKPRQAAPGKTSEQALNQEQVVTCLQLGTHAGSSNRGKEMDMDPSMHRP